MYRPIQFELSIFIGISKSQLMLYRCAKPYGRRVKGAGFYSLISSLKTYHPTLHLTPWSLDLFILHKEHTVLQPFRRIDCKDRIVQSHPSKHKKFVKHVYNVSPAFPTLDQHCINVLQMFGAFWVYQQIKKRCCF